MGSRSNKAAKWPKPQSGGTPKKIVAKNSPGGPQTPGEKAKRKAKEEADGTSE